MPLLLCEKGHNLLKEMMKKILILSDIHGNITALDEVLKSVANKDIEGIILLGDLIDYGPGSNEVIKRIGDIPQEMIVVNIWGNHENAIMNEDYRHFSSERGAVSARYTRKQLTQASMDYLNCMTKEGIYEFSINGKKCLAVHGSLEDVFWKSIVAGECALKYREYEYVFSGHSHIPHVYQHFYESDQEEFRYKKRTVFINPGSVGQPRNHNPNAQFAILDGDNGTVELMAVKYDIESEVRKYSDAVDAFYRERIKRGI